MIMLIVEVLPYLAFVGAGVLIAWVGVDVLRDKKRKGAPKLAEDSGRGLAGTPEPFAGQESGRLVVYDEEPVVEENVAYEIDKEEKTDDSPEIAVSHAVDMAESDEESNNEPREDTPTASEESQSVSENESGESDAFEVSGDVIMVRKDPSVRVFDTSFAASSRKVPATED